MDPLGSLLGNLLVSLFASLLARSEGGPRYEARAEKEPFGIWIYMAAMFTPLSSHGIFSSSAADICRHVEKMSLLCADTARAIRNWIYRPKKDNMTPSVFSVMTISPCGKQDSSIGLTQFRPSQA